MALDLSGCQVPLVLTEAPVSSWICTFAKCHTTSTYWGGKRDVPAVASRLW